MVSLGSIHQEKLEIEIWMDYFCKYPVEHFTTYERPLKLAIIPQPYGKNIVPYSLSGCYFYNFLVQSLLAEYEIKKTEIIYLYRYRFRQKTEAYQNCSDINSLVAADEFQNLLISLYVCTKSWNNLYA